MLAIGTRPARAAPSCPAVGLRSEQRWLRSRRQGGRAIAVAAVGAVVIVSMVSLPSTFANPVDLLGGPSSEWHFDNWRAVTDNVRGGVSTAVLKGGDGRGAVFSGNLDPSKLGAGFAGVSLPVNMLPETMEGLSGLQVAVAGGDGAEYNIALKMRGATSGASHKFHFTADEAAVLDMPFRDFVATKWGRPVAEDSSTPGPLDLRKVDLLTIQIESHFGKQKGPFSLRIDSISGLPRGEDEQSETATVESDTWICASCGTANKVVRGADSATTCVRCGASRDLKVAEVVAPAGAEKTEKWTCRGCGASNFGASRVCYKCGLSSD